MIKVLVVKSYKGCGNEIFTIDFFMKVSFSVFEGLSISPTYVSGSFIQDFVSQYRYSIGIHMICQRIKPIFSVFDFEQLRNKFQKAFMLWDLLKDFLRY